MKKNFFLILLIFFLLLSREVLPGENVIIKKIVPKDLTYQRTCPKMNLFLKTQFLY